MKTAASWSVLTAFGIASLACTAQQDSANKRPPQALCEAAAPKLRESGTTKVTLIIAVDGKGQVEWFKTEVPRGLRLEKVKEAASAIKEMHFKPATKDGSPVAVQIRAEFDCVDHANSSPADEAAPDLARGIVGDIPGGLPPDGNSAIAGILSSEPQVPRAGSPTHLRVAQGVMRTSLVTKVNPIYPSEAERQHVDGTVLLHINIDKNGNVSNIEPVSGHPLLIPAAIDAVKQWKYKPYLLNQAAVEVETTVLIKFVILDGNVYSVIALASPDARSWR